MVEPMELRRPTPGSGGPQGRAPAAGRCRQNGPSGQGAAQQAQAQALQLDQHSTAALNLTVLQRQDPAVEEILLTAGHVTLYDFAVASSTWSRKDVEGSLFVVKRKEQPRFQFLVMNRKNSDNLVEDLLGPFEYEVQVPYLLYRNEAQEVNGIWFYSPKECQEAAKLFSRILQTFARAPAKNLLQEPLAGAFSELEAIPTEETMEGPLEPSGRASAGAGAQDLASEPLKQPQAMRGGLAPQPAVQAGPGPGQTFGVPPGPAAGAQRMPLPAPAPAQAVAPPLTASPVSGAQVLLKPSFFEASSQDPEEGAELEGMGQQQFHFQSHADARPSAPPPPSPLHATAGSAHLQAPGALSNLLAPVVSPSMGAPVVSPSMGAPAGLASAAPMQSSPSPAPNAASQFLSSILLRGEVSAPSALLGPSPPAPPPHTMLPENGEYPQHPQQQFHPQLITLQQQQQQQQQHVAPPGVPKAAAESGGPAPALLPAFHGAPFLQPFPPPVPPASLTHPSLPRPQSLGGSNTITISRDRLKGALLRLVQDERFVDLLFKELRDQEGLQ